MKKSVLFACAAAALLVLSQAPRLMSTARAQAPQPPVSNPTVALLGDSITEGGLWANYFPAQRVLNLGISGDTTTGMLMRLGALVAAKPPKVFIMAGINDLLRGRAPDDVFATYRQIVSEIDSPSRKIFVESTLYVTAPTNMAVNEKVTRLNTLLRQLCEQTRRCTFVDMNTALAPSGQLAQQFTQDGLHLNQAGYEAWFAELKSRHLLE
ncbi:GDSL-type esterase/lipase family protein [Xylophilus sp. GOD-11R]|uniref:GDSL-type esterase/lipase family protein n=1 Tax=Xylophilus sp. GOD-11R TaxID=3089814 RepID=UPI00298BD94C|nr:GDSL-type esterase/lipase family protein [Xylophilus sp. GOD-11R]WPB55256.1 GDSL-type esterase/lipase family protein [Xylophilus sp. GOD-11R]